MNQQKACEIVSKAKPIFFGKEPKGFLFEVDDFISLLDALDGQGGEVDAN